MARDCFCYKVIINQLPGCMIKWVSIKLLAVMAVEFSTNIANYNITKNNKNEKIKEEQWEELTFSWSYLHGRQYTWGFSVDFLIWPSGLPEKQQRSKAIILSKHNISYHITYDIFTFYLQLFFFLYHSLAVSPQSS